MNFKTFITILSALLLAICFLYFAKPEPNHVVTFHNVELVDRTTADLVADYLLIQGAENVDVFIDSGVFRIEFYSDSNSLEIEQWLASFINDLAPLENALADLVLDVSLIFGEDSNSNQGCSGLLLSESLNDYGRSQVNTQFFYASFSNNSFRFLPNQGNSQSGLSTQCFVGLNFTSLPDSRAGPRV